MNIVAGGAVSVVGESHKRSGTALQDSSLYVDGGNQFKLILVSDGAGSARQSHIGSRVLLDNVRVSLENLVKSNLELTEPKFREALLMGVVSARHQLSQGPESLSEYHATLVGALVLNDRSFLMHLGDGLALVFFSDSREKESCSVVISPPENGDSSNETYFFTEHDFSSHLRTTLVPKQVSAVVACSDGMEDFFYDIRTGIKQQFCLPILKEAHSSALDGQLDSFIQEVVQDSRTNQFTSDDKSLAMVLDPRAADYRTVKDQFVLDKVGRPVKLNFSSRAAEGGDSQPEADSISLSDKFYECALDAESKPTSLPVSRKRALRAYKLFSSHLVIFFLGAFTYPLVEGYLIPGLAAFSSIAAEPNVGHVAKPEANTGGSEYDLDSRDFENPNGAEGTVRQPPGRVGEIPVPAPSGR